MILQLGHEGGHDYDVVGHFIVPDEDASKSSNEHSEHNDNEFIVPDGQFMEIKRKKCKQCLGNGRHNQQPASGDNKQTGSDEQPQGYINS